MSNGITVLGIDPGATTGVAIADIRPAMKPEYWKVTSCPIEEMLDMLCRPNGMDVLRRWDEFACAVVEDASLLPIHYSRYDVNSRGHRRSQADALSVARDVGVNIGYGHVIKMLLIRAHVPVIAASPEGRRKLNAELFRQSTGWTDRTNEHGRDAAMLVSLATPQRVQEADYLLDEGKWLKFYIPKSTQRRRRYSE